MNKLRMSGLVLCVLSALAMPAGAQLGGLIKKKVGEAVKGPDKSKEKAKAPNGAQGKGPEFNERVVELTEPVLKGLKKGLDLELAQLTEFKTLLGTYKTEEQYDACKTEVAASAESQKIVLQFANLPENATREQVQRVSEKMNAEMNALINKKCGVSILDEWPDQKRRDKISEIHRNAAATAGLLLSNHAPGQLGESAIHEAPVAGIAQEPASTEPYDQNGAEAAGIRLSRTASWERGESAIDDAAVESAQQQGSTEPLDISEERIDAYCRYKKVAAPGMFPLGPGTNLGFTAKTIDPRGSGSMYYYYTAAEVAAIDPQCVTVTLTVGKIYTIMDQIHIYGKRK